MKKKKKKKKKRERERKRTAGGGGQRGDNEAPAQHQEVLPLLQRLLLLVEPSNRQSDEPESIECWAGVVDDGEKLRHRNEQQQQQQQRRTLTHSHTHTHRNWRDDHAGSKPIVRRPIIIIGFPKSSRNPTMVPFFFFCLVFVVVVVVVVVAVVVCTENHSVVVLIDDRPLSWPPSVSSSSDCVEMRGKSKNANNSSRASRFFFPFYFPTSEFRSAFDRTSSRPCLHIGIPILAFSLRNIGRIRREMCCDRFRSDRNQGELESFNSAHYFYWIVMGTQMACLKIDLGH